MIIIVLRGRGTVVKTHIDFNVHGSSPFGCVVRVLNCLRIRGRRYRSEHWTGRLKCSEGKECTPPSSAAHEAGSSKMGRKSMNLPYVLREFVALIPARLAGISSAGSSVSDGKGLSAPG